ncbi:HAMP domain-containing histidine kinase [Sandaracinobacteroides saxicola]|uniref:histidine kinase n=2 Tax=Sandaracinobacteroides saxicola TaxID=2759707 RepID=A0A7G5IML4_9SPHN|nr:HAMP domain-containing histidine kinase [Sandaracinobacteroides saxicola]
MGLLIAAWGRADLRAATLVAALLVVAVGVSIWRHVSRTNAQLARFIEALRHGDLTQHFAAQPGDSGFDALAASMDAAVARLRAERRQGEDEARFLAALVEDAPVALLSVSEAGEVALLNKAARRRFGVGMGTRLADYGVYGGAFRAFLSEAPAGARREVPLLVDGVQVAMLMSVAVVRSGTRGAVRVVAVESIQRELNRAELSAQADLVRVLTHEIMNSMTPVTSLAASAAGLMAEVEGDDPRVGDAREAVETLAARAEGVMRFVRSYRQLTRFPQVVAQPVVLEPLFAELARLFAAEPAALGVALTVEANGLRMEADPDLLMQALINLLKNAAEAARGHAAVPAVALRAEAAAGRVWIDVDDNGPGVAADAAGDVFLPFFTTKAGGTGVGLSLARQIALAHDGGLAVLRAPGGGARFRLAVGG